MRGVRSGTRACALALLLVLAGCSGGGGFDSRDPEPIPTPDTDARSGTPTPPAVTPAPPESADTEGGRAFLAGLERSGFPVRSVSTNNGGFGVTYVSNDTGDRLLRDAYVLGLAYGGTVNRTWTNGTTWNATRLDGLAVSDSGRALARYRMPASWPLQYFQGRISAETLTDRIRASLERTDSSGQFPQQDGELNALYVAADDTAVDVAGATTRNRTAYLTVRAPTSDREQFRTAVQEVVTAYGAETTDWDTAALELSIRDREGEFHGWYRADADFAANVSAGRANVTLEARRYLPNEGRLVRTR
ncbi:hypothetical protein [Halorientalis halophila]|uniref:hypothetical protein n=1 Tax=Halorientalis halophila TaxID=3108499 RepID=UPI0030080CCD